MMTVATIAMCAISILLVVSTYMLASIRHAHEVVVVSLIGIRDTYQVGFEALTADMRQLEARVKALEGSGTIVHRPDSNPCVICGQPWRQCVCGPSPPPSYDPPSVTIEYPGGAK